jgi:hypothetical protein
MANCENCGCTLGRTVETPIDRSLAFTALLDLDPAFGPMEQGKGSERITAFLADWHGSGHTDMYAYAREWIAAHPAETVEQERIEAAVADAEANPYLNKLAPADPFQGIPNADGSEDYRPAGSPAGRLPYPEGSVHEPPLQSSYGPNADGNPYAQYTPEHRVWAKAQEHGKAAASWVFGPEFSEGGYRRILAGLREGDSAVLDSLDPNSPHLVTDGGSEEGYTESALLHDAGWVPHDGTNLQDELISQYQLESRAAFEHEVERLARDQVEPVTEPSELNSLMEPDHVIRVLDEHRVTEPREVYAPELVMFVDEDGQAGPDSDDELRAQAKDAGWQLLTGWTGQHGYRGVVMHPSEFVGGHLAEHILGKPGDYVVVTVETDDIPAGWAVAYRPPTEGES